MIKPILQENKQNTPILGCHLRMPRPLAGCSETLQRFNEVLSNLTRPWCDLPKIGQLNNN